MTTVHGWKAAKFEELLAGYISAKHGFACLVLTIKVKCMLAQINSDPRDVLHGSDPLENSRQRRTSAREGVTIPLTSSLFR
jgi:hypothetical protein